jgi:steroid delta-isomerase-like uncharacterized protein
MTAKGTGGVINRKESIMAENEALSLAREGVEAFSNNDWQRFKAPLAPDAVYQELATGLRIQGPDQIVQAIQGWKQAFPDARGKITNAFASGNTVCLEITWEGTHTGPMVGPGGTIPASNKRTTTSAVQVITVEGNKVKLTRHYFDLMSLLQQIGAVPQ